MIQVQDYLPAARQHEPVFRAILRDLRDKRQERPGGTYVPQDLETELPLEDLFARYSAGHRMGKFTVARFSVEGDEATIAFRDVAPMSGGGAEVIYRIRDGLPVEPRAGMVMMS